MMKTVFEYTRENILVIPQALYAMKDVSVVMQGANSVMFLKHLEHDLVDVEFYTNYPCFVYIESGCEVLTNAQNEVIELQAGSAIFLPQGATLHSDYVKQTQSLRACLVFFDQQVITEYLSKTGIRGAANTNSGDFYVIHDRQADFQSFMASLKTDITEPGYFNVKLQELLHLIAWKGDAQRFHALLLSKGAQTPKRNLRRLLDAHDILHLSVRDLALLSGRSLSSFQRDFKASYQTTPQKWLQEKRLAHAHRLLDGGDCSVTEAAAAVGYENISHFIRAFRLKYGQTPKQLKTKQLKMAK